MHTRKRGGLDYRQDIFVKEMLKQPNPRLRDREYQCMCADLAGYKGHRKKNFNPGEHPLDKVVDGLMTNPRVLAALEGHKLEEALEKEYGPDNILRDLIKISKVNIADYSSWGPEGVTVIPSRKLSRDQTARIVRIRQRTTRWGIDIDIELEKRIDAIDKLARIHGMYKDSLKLEDTLKAELEAMTEEEIKEQLFALLAADPNLAQDVANVANNILATSSSN